MSAIRLLLVDDHPVFRRGLQRVLEEDGRFHVAGQADDGESALLEVAACAPQVVLLDLSLRGRNGLELIPELQAAATRPAILVISMHDETLYAERALRAGALGFVGKDAPPAEICEAVAMVARGERSVSRRIEAMFQARAEGAAADGAPAGERLTNRELEVLRLLASGRKTAAIAAELGISPKTVETHRASLKTKLGAETPGDLLRMAFERFPGLGR